MKRSKNSFIFVILEGSKDCHDHPLEGVPVMNRCQKYRYVVVKTVNEMKFLYWDH